MSGETVAIKQVVGAFDKVPIAKRCLRELALLRHLQGHLHVSEARYVPNIFQMTSVPGYRSYRYGYAIKGSERNVSTVSPLEDPLLPVSLQIHIHGGTGSPLILLSSFTGYPCY